MNPPCAPESGTDRRRMAQGIIAQILAMGSRVAVQLATLPLLFAFWPTEKVGAWMLLFALPAYLALVALAFAGAGGSAALAAAQQGRLDEARTHFRTSWIIATVSTLALGAAALAILPLLPAMADAGEAASDGSERWQTLAWLAAYVFASAQMAVLAIPFRVAGRYPLHTLITGAASLGEIPVIAACVALDGSFVVLAAGLALSRFAFAAAMLVTAWGIVPALFSRHAAGLGKSFGQLWRPSLAFMTMPLILALNLQGYVVLAGAYYGAVALAAFVATRTLVRLIELVNGVAYAVQFNEAGYLGDRKLAMHRRQLATATLLSLAMVGGFAVVLFVAGPWFQRVFTSGKTAFDPVLAAVLLAAGLLRALSTAPEAMIAADNRQGALVAIYLAGSLLALGGAMLLAGCGASLAVTLSMLVLAELTQAVPGFAVALRRLDLTSVAFLRSLVARERWSDLLALARLLRHRQ